METSNKVLWGQQRMETAVMCDTIDTCSQRALSFETMLTDPLIRLMMDSDGVSVADMVNVLTGARDALAQREMDAYRAAAAF